jgi:L-alanine-DL-glutamate epimerase-like enolase superfamily enzyme
VRIDQIEVFRAAAGWKTHSFVKVVTESGTIGWAEFSHDFGGVRSATVDAAAISSSVSGVLVGAQVGSAETADRLEEFSRRSGRARQLVGAISNALLDIEARERGLPVHELLGGALRDRIPLYWAHCGTYRMSHASLIGVPAIRSLDDIRALGAEVSARGYRALKCNLMLFGGDKPRRFKAESEVRLDDRTVAAVASDLESLLAAFREGAGRDVALLVDVGAGFPSAAATVLACAAARHDVRWVEIESASPTGLSAVRAAAGVAVATGERLTFADYTRYIAAGAADVMIVDVPYLGARNAVAVAADCAEGGVLVAPHNCYSPLATLMSAAFCAVVPNLALMEFDVDGVPWEDSFVVTAPVVRAGYLEIPDGPGWGTDVDEEVVRAHAVN